MVGVRHLTRAIKATNQEELGLKLTRKDLLIKFKKYDEVITGRDVPRARSWNDWPQVAERQADSLGSIWGRG